MLCKIVRPLTSNPSYPVILVPEAINPDGAISYAIVITRSRKGSRPHSTVTAMVMYGFVRICISQLNTNIGGKGKAT